MPRCEHSIVGKTPVGKLPLHMGTVGRLSGILAILPAADAASASQYFYPTRPRNETCCTSWNSRWQSGSRRRCGWAMYQEDSNVIRHKRPVHTAPTWTSNHPGLRWQGQKRREVVDQRGWFGMTSKHHALRPSVASDRSLDIPAGDPATGALTGGCRQYVIYGCTHFVGSIPPPPLP